MTALQQAISDAAAALAAAGVHSARADAEQLAAHVLDVERGRLMFAEPGPGFLGEYRALVGQRTRRIPLQHLLGSAAFGPLTLTVGPGVFIPRPETEALLEWAQDVAVPPGGVIVDLCTGSGALALALAAHRPDTRVIAVEQSEDALRYARANAATTRVELVHGDVTDRDVLADLTGEVDLVVANPPYIPDGADLEPEVAEHDPHAALFGGPDGMAVIGPIVALAARLLRSGGQVGVEHDDTTSATTVECFGAEGVFTGIAARRDLAGRHRFVTAVRS